MMNESEIILGEEVRLFPDNIIGNLEIKKDTLREKEVHWNLPNFVSLSDAHYHHAPIFTFLNVRWYLRLNPLEAGSQQMTLDLEMDDVGFVYNTLCTFAIKKADDSLVGAVSYKHIFCERNCHVTVHRFFSRTEIFQRRSELLPEHKLTIICYLKKLPDPAKFTELDVLSEKIKGLFTSGEFCDVTLLVKGKEFKSHKTILGARSSVFANYFKNENSKKENDIVNIPDCVSESFLEFLEYLYSGKIEIISFRSAVHLYKTADKYDVQELKMFCAEHMEHNLDRNYFYDVLYLAVEYNDTNLLGAVQHFFNCNLGEIFSSDEWQNLTRNNFSLANKLLLEMSSNIEVMSKRRRLQ